MKFSSLLMEAYKILLKAADEAKASKLDDERFFENVIKSADEIAVALTEMRMRGKLDPEEGENLETLLKT